MLLESPGMEVRMLFHRPAVSMGASELEMLSVEERRRAALFVHRRHRRHYAMACVYRRMILSELLGLPPQEVVFVLGPHGKPALADVGAVGLEFNVSHTAGVIAVALSRLGRVGVDIERAGSRRFPWEASTHCFSDDEAALLEDLHVEDRQQRAFALWTCKEAILKAEGRGLAVSPREVDTGTRFSDRLSGVRVIGFLGRKWKVETRCVAKSWVASVAAEVTSPDRAHAHWSSFEWVDSRPVPASHRHRC